ncbi:hypothetical protein [Bailinhaonella thermotolerans]|uniref:Uncharacterized protein n=1 Tax=Bailinhaonella thermotolerans TaxID=1070861 RepID=A0A3A4B0S7_9ACTN|nr:hypothetical protein [Bailinhaonella thermotolerans]RJL31627.1 hypothetical protein D5H75_18095 [Bailinhaonella thermotolerans]
MTDTLTKIPRSTPVTTEDAQRVVDQICADDELAWQVAAELDRDPRRLLAKLFALTPARQAAVQRIKLERARSTFSLVARALREGDRVIVRVNEVADVATAFKCSISASMEMSLTGGSTVTVEAVISR